MSVWAVFFLTVSLLTVIPLIPSRHWIVKGWTYIYHQLAFLNLILVLVGIIQWQVHTANQEYSYLWICNVAGLIFLMTRIFPYLPFAPKEIADVQASTSLSQVTISLLVANVLQDNREYARTLLLIKNYQPDLILLVETDAGWVRELSSLEEIYPFHLYHAKDNYYGMTFLSKYPVLQQEVFHLIEKEIPSTEVKLSLGENRCLHFYGVHPRPPSPTEASTAVPKDQELVAIAKKIIKLSKNIPVIVAGDLNDVAWSQTTRLFQKISGQLDPRRGRGFYSTFPAYLSFLRAPIDHIFCSRHFSLQTMKCTTPFGSDHLGMYAELVVSDQILDNNAHLSPTQNDIDQAEEILRLDR